MKDGLVVGIDIATSDVRALAVDPRGTVLAQAAGALPPVVRPHPGWAEQDARALWPALATVLRDVTTQLGADRQRIVAVASATTSGTVLLADRKGEPIGPALAYDDARAVAEAARAQEIGRTRWESLGIRVAPSFALAKLAWLAARPEGLDGAAHAWSVADLVVSRLLGAPGPTDWSHALKSGYDLVRREWALDVYEALGVPTSLLPLVQPPSTLAGVVGATAASETGLPQGCEVRLGMTDGCAAQLASGAVLPGRFVGVLGTTLVIKGTTAELLHDPDGVVYSHLHPDGWWLPGGASNTGGEALLAFGRDRFANLDRAAGERGPARCVSYPLARAGERFPFLEPEANGFMLGKPADDVEAYRATLEGVAFVERLAYDRLAELGAVPYDSVATAGGASRSQVWNRIRATVLGLPLNVPTTPTSAFGAALLAASGTLYANLATASAAMVSGQRQVDPEPMEQAAMTESYARFLAELRDRGWIAARARAAEDLSPPAVKQG